MKTKTVRLTLTPQQALYAYNLWWDSIRFSNLDYKKPEEGFKRGVEFIIWNALRKAAGLPLTASPATTTQQSVIIEKETPHA